MVKTVTSINGRLVKRGQDKISVFDNALLYAEGLFETFLAIDEKIIFEKEHLRRLRQGTRLIGLDLDVDNETLHRWMIRILRRHPDRICKLRMTVTSGEAARWVGRQGRPQVILSAAPHKIPTAPYSLQVSKYRIDQDSEFRRIKTISYAIHAVALSEARKSRCDDALLLNEKDQIAEVTSANIFWVRKGRIFTPPLSAGCLEGITRKIVGREAKKLGYQLTEKNITLSKLLNADELFISSSLKLILPADRIKDSQRIHRLPPGPIGQHLCSHFRKLLGC